MKIRKRITAVLLVLCVSTWIPLSFGPTDSFATETPIEESVATPLNLGYRETTAKAISLNTAYKFTVTPDSASTVKFTINKPGYVFVKADYAIPTTFYYALSNNDEFFDIDNWYRDYPARTWTTPKVGLKPGTYYLSFGANEGEAPSKNSCTLRVGYKADSYWEKEPNNTKFYATSIQLGKTYNGRCTDGTESSGSSDTEDYYKIKISQKNKYTISVNEGGYKVVDLLDFRGEWIDAFITYSSRANWSLTTSLNPSTYYIRVAQGDDRVYKLSVKKFNPGDLRIQSIIAAKHEIGKVTFMWTKKSGSTGKWSIRYRWRKIGGNNKWSSWTTTTHKAGTLKTVIKVPKNYCVEVQGKGAGDKSWSKSIFTTPAGGKYQSMKYVHVKNVSTNKRVTSITLKKGQTVKLRPDYDYPVKDYKKRPRLYPNHMFYDDFNKSVISVRNDRTKKAYNGTMVDGTVTIKGLKAGTTTITCRAPNGRTMKLKVTVK